MLRLLLDEHISPSVATSMRRAEKQIQVEPLIAWQDGRYVGLSDGVILTAAYREGWTLVTYDQATIVPLLVTWAASEEHHGGVIFISHWSIPQNDFGALARTLVSLWQAERRRSWTDRCVYAHP